MVKHPDPTPSAFEPSLKRLERRRPHFRSSLKRVNGDAGTFALRKYKAAAKQGPSPAAVNRRPPANRLDNRGMM
jgi:hypothetical protein